MIDSELLKILCCPETHQDVAVADPQLIERLNQQISAGKAVNRAGKPVQEKIEGGLIRQDRKILYPIRDKIPVMLIDEGIQIGEPPISNFVAADVSPR